MKHESLLRAQDTALVMVDMQERLIPAMVEQERLLKYCHVLAQTAELLKLPVLLTEQYPKGLGPTLPELMSALPPSTTPLEKTSFSCARAPGFMERLKQTHANQILLCGIEAHVCVLQTALDLTAMGYQVHLVFDAVSSRNPLNAENAICRMRQAGIVITNTESALFEMLNQAEGDTFKAISKLIR